ncbi:MAG: efflux transporter outer membrane subunit [Gammaproteobacteria bacterium]|nr:efflux transporter outer membrane subunit [Gammaproteobacteria bacterium]
MITRPIAVPLALVAALTGCAVGPDYHRPELALPDHYPDANAADTAGAEITPDWWTLYSDAELDRLITQALQNNADLRRAVAQIDEAEAVLSEARATLFPEIDLGLSSSRTRSSTLNAQPLAAGVSPVSNSHRLALSTSFELDLWGRLRRASEAAQAQLLGTRYGRDVTALALTGATAQAYFLLRSLDAQITVTQQTLTTREESLAVARSRATGGLASELDVYQAETGRADVALQLRELQRQRALVEHQLGVLTGTPDLALAPGDLMQLPLPAEPPAGLPSTLLERRPDVQQAEQALIAANARIGVSRAAQFPTFTLTGAFGGQSEEFSDLLESGARIWSIGLGATMPLLDAGRYSARTRQAEAVQSQALADYQQAVETAFREVADALTNAESARAAAEDQEKRVTAARSALRLSQKRYEAGYSGYLEVLDAQRTANTAEQALIQHRQAQLAYSVDLIKALGGGWSAAVEPDAR